MDPATALAIGSAAAGFGSGFFAPEGQDISSFQDAPFSGSMRTDDPFSDEPRFVNIKPTQMLADAQGFTRSLAELFGDRAFQPVTRGNTLPSAFVQQPATFCMAPDHRILTADFRWVPCGDLAAGDEILGFDEEPRIGGRNWQRSKIIRSVRTRAQCVRVVLDDGTEIVCTVDHPWLVEPNLENGVTKKRWARADELMRPYSGTGRYPEVGFNVLRALDTWDELNTRDAGWIAGMYDGEGHCNHARNNWRIEISQSEGAVADQIVRLMEELGFELSVKILSQKTGTDGPAYTRDHWKMDLLGGLAEGLRFLGSVRPIRMIENFAPGMDSRRVQVKDKVGVKSVEPIGEHEVQSIETTSKTYLGEGFLMHNSGGGLPFDIGVTAFDAANPFFTPTPPPGGFSDAARAFIEGMQGGGSPVGPGTGGRGGPGGGLRFGRDDGEGGRDRGGNEPPINWNQFPKDPRPPEIIRDIPPPVLDPGPPFDPPPELPPPGGGGGGDDEGDQDDRPEDPGHVPPPYAYEPPPGGRVDVDDNITLPPIIIPGPIIRPLSAQQPQSPFGPQGGFEAGFQKGQGNDFLRALEMLGAPMDKIRRQ